MRKGFTLLGLMALLLATFSMCVGFWRSQRLFVALLAECGRQQAALDQSYKEVEKQSLQIIGRLGTEKRKTIIASPGKAGLTLRPWGKNGVQCYLKGIFKNVEYFASWALKPLGEGRHVRSHIHISHNGSHGILDTEKPVDTDANRL